MDHRTGIGTLKTWPAPASPYPGAAPWEPAAACGPALRRVAECRGHAPRPRRRPRRLPPAAPRRRAARPDRLGPVRDRRVRHPRHQAGPRLGRPHPRPVRPGRRRRRRRTPLAHLLADPRPAPRPLHQPDRQGDPRRRRLQPPRAPRPRRARCSSSSRPRASSCSRSRCRSRLLLVTAGSGITPVIGMLRNLFSRKTPVDHRHRARARQRQPGQRDLPRRAARPRDVRATSGWSSGTTTATACSTSPTSPTSSPTSTSGSPTPAGRPACSTRSRSTTPSAA